MKTERRHELEQNDLADRLVVVVDRVKSYGLYIVGVIVAAGVVYVASSIIASSNATARGLAWSDCFQAIGGGIPDVVRLKEIVEEQGDTDVGLWARIVVADILASDGMDKLFIDRESANEDLDSAMNHYEHLLAVADQQDLIARASIGLARVNESLDDLEKARELYQKVAESAIDNPFRKFAQERLDNLNRADEGEFYDWFTSAKPLTGLQNSASGISPSFDIDSLSDGPSSARGAESLLDLGTPESSSELPGLNLSPQAPEDDSSLSEPKDGEPTPGAGNSDLDAATGSDVEAAQSEGLIDESSQDESPASPSGGSEASDGSAGPSLGQPN